MKKLLSIYFLVSILTVANAQESVLDAGNSGIFQNYNKVMLIPFNANFYFSDADKELAEYNKKSEKEIQKLFRAGLDFDINARILSMYDTKQMLDVNDEEVEEDLEAIYSGLSYGYEKPKHPDGCTCEDYCKEGKPKSFFKKFEETLKIDNDNGDERTDAEAYQSASGYVEPAGEKKYMGVTIKHPEMLEFYKEKYGTDLFVFINQFELKTKYEACLDRSIKKFTREVWVHFSIYDANGTLLYGDVVVVDVPSNTNNLDQIIRNHFPLVTDELASNMPKVKTVH